MKRLTAITVLCVLFLSAFAAGKDPAGVPGYPDSLRSVWLYTEGIKQNAIARDTVRAREFFAEAIRNDSTFAPAYYEMAANGMYSTPDEAVNLARTAFRLDTANKWYHQFLGQALIYARRYDEALAVYRRLRSDEPQNPDNYRILAALYEQAQQPFSAIATLDSAEVRFGRIPVLSTMKRQLLVATRQMDKAVEEAEAMVEAVPYEAEHHVVLADLYGILGKDSLANAEYDRALQTRPTWERSCRWPISTTAATITGRCWTLRSGFSSRTRCRSTRRSNVSGSSPPTCVSTANITPSSIRWPRRLPSATRRTGASWNFMPNT